MSLRKMYYRLPISMRYLARRLWFGPRDFIDQLSGKRTKFTPPRGMIFTGPGDFIREGQKLLKQFIQFGKLKPSDQVLDIGSGIGRAAVALTSHLEPETKYLGFDPVKKGIDWCTKNISTEFPNFVFQYIPLKNDLYQKSGQSANEFIFPFEENVWDFVVLTSVFTHMVPTEINHYLSEINRMLSDEGRVFATFFILADERKISNSSYQFPYHAAGYALMDKEVASANVAVEKAYLEKMIADNGLQILSTHLGFWNSGIRQEHPNFQDVLILGKK